MADAEGDAAERVHQLGEQLHQLQATATELAARLDRQILSDDALREISTSIPVLGGNVQTLESRLDAVQLPDGEAKQKRRKLNATDRQDINFVCMLEDKANTNDMDGHDIVHAGGNKFKGEG